MNPAARWETAALYDRRELWGTEARAFAGNFLYSTGANERAGRYTAGHFDLPLRNCTIHLDDRLVVDSGRLVAELAAERACFVKIKRAECARWAAAVTDWEHQEHSRFF